MIKFRVVIALAALGSVGGALRATPALADQAAGDHCASTLTPQAAMIYRATAPNIHKDTVIADALKASVRPMVMNGQIDRAAAQSAAQAAGQCLKLLRD